MAVKVAFLGPRGTYTHQAAIQQFGEDASQVELCPQTLIGECFQAIDDRRVDFSVVPFENSTNGQVVFTYDLIRDWYLNKDPDHNQNTLSVKATTTDSNPHVTTATPPSTQPVSEPTPSFRVVGEQFVHIHHNLITRATLLAEIKTVYSHPQVWTQVTRFLQTLPSDVVREDKPSTSEAAATVARDLTNTSACILSAMSARLYGLPVMTEGVEDNQNNTTRFLVLGYEKPARAADEKGANAQVVNTKDTRTPGYLTSLIFTLRSNSPGSLCQALTTFMNHSVDLITINSRPSQREQWQYVFFVEALSSNPHDEGVTRCVEELQQMCSSVVVLGQFERSE